MQRVFLFAIIFWSLFFVPNMVYARSSEQAKQNLQNLIERRECQKCDLSGLDLTRKDLSHTNLRGADLSFSICNLTNFSHADLRGVTLHGASLIGTDMEGADLRQADFRGTSMESVFLGDALLDDSPQSGGQFAKPVPVIAALGRERNKKDISKRASRPVKPPLIRAMQQKKRVNIEPVFIAAEKRKQLTAAIECRTTADGKVLIRALHRKEKIRQQYGTPARFVPAAADAKKEGDSRTLMTAHAKKTQPSPLPDIQVKKALPQLVPVRFTAEKKESGLLTPLATGKKTGSFIEKEPTADPITTEAQGSSAFAEDEEGLSLAAPVDNSAKRPLLLQLLNTRKCYGCDLSGLDLSDWALAGADLERANLTGCNLQRTDLRRANLKAAQLVQAKMQQAQLDGADLYKANLAYANLTGASTTDTDFDSVRLQGVIGLKKK